MLRKQTKKILVVMLFALTLVLAGRVDANAQTAAPAGVKQVKAGSSSVTVQWNAVMQNDIAIITASVMMQALRAIPPEANVIIMHPKVIFPVFLRERVIMSRSEHLQQNHPVHRMILHGQKRSKL